MSHKRKRFSTLSDDELAEIRRRKIERLKQMAAEPKVKEPLANGSVNLLTDANFWKTIQKTKTAMVDFFGTWCTPCKALASIFQQLAQDYKGDVYFAKVDIDRNPRITAQFGVQSVPMVVVFKNRKPAGNLPGLRRYADYDMVIQQLLET